MKRTPPKPAPAAQIRVAIYCRQSVASELEFGSIDAQREAVEAFVASKRGEGWVALPTRYDDHGFSGGTTDRPAFQRLIADVEAGKVDIIASYKLDRVSRSLADFTAFMADLDRRGVGFCSVTQSFDSLTSMGKLVMNLLGAFGEFERATISERTADKARAARRRGLWTGGRPVLGYDVRGGALVANTTEADTVRLIFRLYLEHGGLVATVAELARRGITNKSWRNRSGKPVRGGPFTKGSLHALLTNPLYVGKVRCGDELVPGRHEAIVEAPVFEQVARALREHRRTAKVTTGRWGAILTGILVCGRCGAAMTHAANVRGTRVHRYYCCTTLQKQGAAACPGSRAPAGALEDVVLGRIRHIGNDPDLLLATLRASRAARENEVPPLVAEARRLQQDRTTLAGQRRNLLDALQHGGVAANTIAGRLGELDAQLATLASRHDEVTAQLSALQGDTVDEASVREALGEFQRVWDELIPRERQRVLRLLVEHVRYDGQAGEVEIRFRETGIRSLAREVHDRRSA